MPDKGTRNAIFVLRSLCERSVEHQSGTDPRGSDRPPKTYESNFIHHDFEQFGKQHSRYKAILPLELFHHSNVVKYTSSLLQ